MPNSLRTRLCCKPWPVIHRITPCMHAHLEVLQRLFHRQIPRRAFVQIDPLQPRSRILCRLICQTHRLPPSSARTLTSARERCAFTVPSLSPVACAISLNSCSSTNRSRNTVRCRSLSPLTEVQTRSTCSRANKCFSAEPSLLASHSLASSRSTAFVCVCRQNCIRRFRQWSFCRLIAIRISHVIALDSPRKLPQFRCAFRKHSCVRVSARSTSLVDASRNRKICGLCRSTTHVNSSAAISAAVAMVIGFTAVPDAITQVDTPFGCKFTVSWTIVPHMKGRSQTVSRLALCSLLPDTVI